ncbi:hypothetical protein WN48_08706 [Eufriesea mexicana]|uniref:uncharacterized protein LOC108545911 n=1 Tax=Eufriesea mexicana TaxID=516756 RepID=UPI00083BB5B2|nr:PREDICTED: uncharacterized protein LOC108545911 [Eufriesea mexicana]OAD59598.1 hypothetical protein WN48_08706 [Eufriesea mexicana]
MEKHFAALKLLDCNKDWKLTKVLNYSETPSSHEICVTQIYQSKTQTDLIRQSSYEKIFDEHANTRQIEKLIEDDNTTCNQYRTAADLTTFNSFKRQSCKSSHILQAPKFISNKISNEILSNEVENTNATNESNFSSNCSITHTDTKNEIDHSSSAQFRNYEEANNEAKIKDATKSINSKTYQNIKNKFRPLVIKSKTLPKKKRNMCYCSCLSLFILPIVAVIIAMFCSCDIARVCNRTTLFLNASQELQKKIHGQENAVSHIIKYLSEDTFYLKVLCLIGGTGVGKSYTAQIIAQHFSLQKDILIYDMYIDHVTDINTLNSVDSYQLIIMENLKMKDLDTFSNVINELTKKKDKCITVIGIFNAEEVNTNLERKVDLIQSANTIHEALANKEIVYLIVPFQPLNKETLQICITEAAAASNLILTLDQINEIEQSLLLFGNGCKRAYSKVQIVGKAKI